MKILILILFTLIAFGLMMAALIFSRYKNRAKKNQSKDKQKNECSCTCTNSNCQSSSTDKK